MFLSNSLYSDDMLALPVRRQVSVMIGEQCLQSLPVAWLQQEKQHFLLLYGYTFFLIKRPTKKKKKKKRSIEKTEKL